MQSLESSMVSLTVPFDEAELYNTPPSSPELDDSKSEKIIYGGVASRRFSAQDKLDDLMALIKNVHEAEEVVEVEERVCQSFDVPRAEYFKQVLLVMSLLYLVSSNCYL
jgi:hypothetical protein